MARLVEFSVGESDEGGEKLTSVLVSAIPVDVEFLVDEGNEGGGVIVSVGVGDSGGG